MAYFLVKFPIFRYRGNRSRLSKVWLTPLNWPIPKTPSRCKNLWRISCTSWVIANFLLKIANFRCHGNKDMSAWRSFSLGCHFHVHFSYPWHAFASHGLPAIAELLVFLAGGIHDVITHARFGDDRLMCSLVVWGSKFSNSHWLCWSSLQHSHYRVSVILHVCFHVTCRSGLTATY